VSAHVSPGTRTVVSSGVSESAPVDALMVVDGLDPETLERDGCPGPESVPNPAALRIDMASMGRVLSKWITG